MLAAPLTSTSSLVSTLLLPRFCLHIEPRMPSPYNESDCEDWYATDSEEDAASPAPASSSTVTTTGGNPGKRRADNAPARPAPQKKRQRPAEENSPSPVANDWEVKPIGGTCPPLNSKSTIVDDPTNHRVFFVGGIRPGEESEKLAKPTSDLWCYDTKAMTWIDLTVSPSPSSGNVEY